MTSNSFEIRKIDSLLLPFLEPNTKILKYETRLLTAPGENYGSVMLAVDVTIQEPQQPPKTMHLVAKLRPANDMLCEMFNVQETFKKEIGMYLDVIPCLTKFQEEYGSTERKLSDLFAKSYGARINLNPGSDIVDDDAVLILENLKISGYDVEDRMTGFGKDHVYKILEDLARFHAIPIAYKIIKPYEFKKIITPVTKITILADGISKDLLQKSIDEIINCIVDIKECIPYLDKIYKLIDDSLQGLSRYLEPKEPFATIIHTDYWVNNTMILKNEHGKPIKNKIVDLQLPLYNSGAMDLLFFLHSSIIPKILNDNIDSFIKFYHDCFIECLQEFDLDINPFSWENFTDDLKRIAPAELGHILIMYKPILTQRGTIDDMTTVDLDTMFCSDPGPEYKNRVIECVFSFIKNKWL